MSSLPQFSTEHYRLTDERTNYEMQLNFSIKEIKPLYEKTEKKEQTDRHGKYSVASLQKNNHNRWTDTVNIA